MKIVYRAGDVTEAEIVKGMLLLNDIEAHVSGYYLQGGIGEMAPTDLAKVYVPDENFEQARGIVRKYEGDQTEQISEKKTIEYSESTPAYKFLIVVIIVVAISVFGFLIGV